MQSWGQLDAAKAQIEATTAQVNAAEIALNGVREEYVAAAQIKAWHEAADKLHDSVVKMAAATVRS